MPVTCITLARFVICFFFSSRRRHTRLQGDWSSDVCSSDLTTRSPATSSTQGHRFASTSRCRPAPARAKNTRYSGRERSEEHTSELQSPCNLVCRLLLEKKKKKTKKKQRKEINKYIIRQTH